MSSTIYRRSCPAPDPQCERYGMFCLGALGKAPFIFWVVLSCIRNYTFEPRQEPNGLHLNVKEEHETDFNSKISVSYWE